LAKATNYEDICHYIFFILSLPVSLLTQNVGTGPRPERNKHSLLKIHTIFPLTDRSSGW